MIVGIFGCIVIVRDVSAADGLDDGTARVRTRGSCALIRIVRSVRDALSVIDLRREEVRAARRALSTRERQSVFSPRRVGEARITAYVGIEVIDRRVHSGIRYAHRQLALDACGPT